MYPVHVAIIMDGNGRWAKKIGLPRLAGHKAGVKKIHKVVELTIINNIKYLTLYAFSSENWSRPKSEINDLMHLLSTFLNKDAKDLLKKNIKLKVIGRRDRLKKDIRSEIINIYKKASLENIDIENISLADIENNLMTKGIPDPDLIIRTSGEYRVSNFLLWQSAYSEYEFVKCNWPDFDKKEYLMALNNYENRERRFGNLNE